jgi:Transposase
LDVVLWTETEGGQMPRKGHSEEQIITALRQVEAGKKVSDVCREMGVSQQAFYSWKRKYAGLALNELRQIFIGSARRDAGRGVD